MGKFILSVVGFLLKRKYVFFICLLLLIGLLITGILRLKINDSIFSVLPKDKSFEQFNQLISNKNLSGQVIFSITLTDKNDAEETANLADYFADTLQIISKD